MGWRSKGIGGGNMILYNWRFDPFTDLMMGGMRFTAYNYI